MPVGRGQQYILADSDGHLYIATRQALSLGGGHNLRLAKIKITPHLANYPLAHLPSIEGGKRLPYHDSVVVCGLL